MEPAARDLEAQNSQVYSSRNISAKKESSRVLITTPFALLVGIGVGIGVAGLLRKHPTTVMSVADPFDVVPSSKHPCLRADVCWPANGLHFLQQSLSPGSKVLDGFHAATRQALAVKCADPASFTANPPLHQSACDMLLNSTDYADFWRTSLNLNPASFRMPGLIVQVATDDDVRHCLDWAAEHRIPISIRNTGHGYNGQGMINGGLMIDITKMNEVSVDAQAQTMSLGGGSRWGAAYKAADDAGVSVVGGYDPTVGVVGCVIGGCHGPLSRRYGYGADNVVSFRAVLPGGVAGRSQIVTVDAMHHADLFWAVRGGGPGFAVITEMTLRVHPFPKGNASEAASMVYTYVFDFCPMTECENASSNLTYDCTLSSLKRFTLNSSWWTKLGPDWGGYSRTCAGVFYYRGDDLDKELAENEAVISVSPSLLFKFSSELAFHDGKALVEYVTAGSVLTNVVPSEIDAFSAGGAEAVAAALCDVNNCNPLLVNGVLGAKTAHQRGDHDNAVGEGLRAAFGPEVVFAHSKTETFFDPVYFEALQAVGEKVYPYFSSSYVNEWTRQGEYNDMKDWQHRFWGNTTYERLLRVKQHYDPCNVLGVDKSVGDGEPVSILCPYF